MGIVAALVLSCVHRQKDRGDVLTIGAWEDIGEIDPISARAGGGYFLMEALFDGLVRHDEGNIVRPLLAESWAVSGDGRTWTFDIRKGVKFHDGHELTSEDVKFTMEKIMDPAAHSFFASALGGLTDIIEKGPYEIEIRMKEPNFVLNHFCIFGIVPKHAYKKRGFRDMPIGTGPFKMVHLDDKGAVLRANGDYFLGRPYLDGIRVRVYKSQLEAWSRLMAGDIDVFQPVLPRNYKFLETLPDMRLYSSLHPYYYILGFNMRDGLFRDKNVRLGLSLAVDRQALVREVLQGKGKEASGPLFPLNPPSPPLAKGGLYNPDKAIILLKKSGWVPGRDGILRKNGKPLEFSCLTFEADEILRETGAMIQDQLSRIGVRMELKTVTAKEFVNGFENKRFQSVLLYYTALIDSDIHFIFFHSSQADHGLNWLSYKNPVVDELLERGRMEPDQEKRQRVYSLFQEELQNDPPGIFLFWREYLAGVNKRFRGVKMGPGGFLWNLGEWWVPREEQKYRGEGKVFN